MRRYITSILLTLSISTYAQWTEIYHYDSTQFFRDIEFINDTTGFAISYSDILKTTDAGTTWSHNTDYPSQWYDVDFTNADTGIICCSSDVLLTYDGGTTWQAPDTPVGPFSDIELVDSGNIIAIGKYGVSRAIIQVYDDYFNTFVIDTLIETFAELPTQYELEFPTQDTGYATGDFYVGSFILNTVDGGLTWFAHEGMLEPRYLLTFPSPSVGYGVSSDYKMVWKTSNYGASWNPLAFETDGIISAMDFYSEDTGYVVIENQIYPDAISAEIFRTEDGGNSWIKTDFYDTTDLVITSISCTSADTCYLTTWHKIYKTSNGGGISTDISTPSIHISKFNLYPNPAADQLTISCSQNIQNISTRNILGQIVAVVFTRNTGTNFTANVHALPAGIYFTSVETSEGTIVKKWVKE